MTPRALRRPGPTNPGLRTFSPRDVVSAAALAGRRHWQRVVFAAVLVFGVTALAETAVEAYGRDLPVGWVVVVGLLSFGAEVLGEVFFVGLLDRLVAEAAHGGPAQRIPTVLRTLPYGPLVLADILLTALVLLGLFAFVVPGVIVFTLLCLSGPIVNIEGVSAVRGLRRSAHLVRGRFWLALILVTVPIFTGEWIAGAIEDAVHGLPLAADFVIRVVMTTVVGIVTGLVQVELAHRLIEADAERQRR